MINRFQKNYFLIRNISLILASIIILATTLANSYTLEIEFNTPGSEMDRAFEREVERREFEAYERVNRNDERGNESNQRDIDRADRWERSNLS